jgi:ribosome biogenesis GTPase
VSAERIARVDPWVGCVVACEPGVAQVLTDHGEVRASYGGCMLSAIARDRTCIPGPGDWVVLRRWCDDRITIEATWSPPTRQADVVPLRRP